MAVIEQSHESYHIIIQTYMEIIADKLEQILPRKKIDIFGKDQLMHNTLPYYLLAFLVNFGHIGTNDKIFFFIFVVYTVLPMLDQFLSFDVRNPTEEQRKSLEARDFYFKLALYVSVISDWIMFFTVLKMFAQLELTLLSLLKTLAFIFIFSNLQASQFAVAHEIFHKPGIFHRWLGTFHMLKNLYIHFTYEHLYGHHRRVATPEDPASAPKGMNVYRFFIKSVTGSWKSVYEMEKEAKKPFYKNYAVLSLVASALFVILIFKIYGCQAGILYLVQAIGSVFYLQGINYIEHYGLRRQKKPDGTYEKVTIKHSWNAPHRFTNYLLFKLQRHSDHHENSLKPYQTLVSLEQSPQLPHGYTVCIFMCLFPSIWYKIMDPLVDEYNKTKCGNICGDVMKKAVKETRKFIIVLGIFTTSMYIGSLVL